MWYFMLGLALVVPEASFSHGCRGRIARPTCRHGHMVGVQPNCRVAIVRRASATGGALTDAAPAGRATAGTMQSAARVEPDRRAEHDLAQASPTATLTPTPAVEPTSHPATSPSPGTDSGESKSVSPPPAARSGRLPRYYAQLELTDEQRQQVLSIQERNSAQESELERQLNALIAERDEQFRRVLTRGQQRKLRQLEGERGS